ncbi:hypothetical protein C7B76_03425 [filamentous cyanobacterium CCP2]|nr:hypothetical protein C7B76_03425 [filamentous cyanobacterium CCP2]
MSPIMLRQFWSLVESTQSYIPLTLDDKGLEQWLLRQVRSERPLNHDETNLLSAYIQTRLPLIRDLAEERHPSC